MQVCAPRYAHTKKTRDKHEKEVHGKVYEHPSNNEDLGDIDGNTNQSSLPVQTSKSQMRAQ